MRFAALLCALPLIGSAFAAPMPAPMVEIEVPTLDAEAVGIAVPALKREVDVLAAVIELEAEIAAIAPLTNLSLEAEVTVALEAIIVAFDHCGQALGIDIDAEVDASLAIGETIAKRQDTTPQVAKYLAAVVAEVNVLVGVVAPGVATLPTVAALLVKIDSSLCTILSSIELILYGVLTLVADILVDIKCAFCPILSGVLGLLDGLVGGLLGGLVGTVGGLAGDVVGGVLGGILGL